MPDLPDQPIVDKLKVSLRDLWDRIHRQTPDERVYAFGLYTSPCADFAAPFACGEQGLQRAAARYVEKGTYSAAEAADNLRWSVADSPGA